MRDKGKNSKISLISYELWIPYLKCCNFSSYGIVYMKLKRGVRHNELFEGDEKGICTPETLITINSKISGATFFDA